MWVKRELAELGDFIGKAILLVTKYGSYQGGLKAITYTDIHIEVNQGIVMMIPRTVLEDSSTELFIVEESA